MCHVALMLVCRLAGSQRILKRAISEDIKSCLEPKR